MSDAASTTYAVNIDADTSSLDRAEQQLDRIEQSAEEVGETGSQMGTRIGQAGSKIGSTFEDARGEAVKLGAGVEQAGTQAGQSLDGVRESGREMGTGIEQAGTQAGQSLDDVCESGRGMGAGIKNAGEQINTALDDAGSGAVDLESQFKNSGGQIVNILIDVKKGTIKIGTQATQTGSEVERALDKAAKSGKKMGLEIQAAMMRARNEGKHFGPSIKAGAVTAFDMLKTKAKTTFGDVQKGIQKTTKDLGTGFTHPLQTIQQGFVRTFDSALDKVLGIGKKTKEAGKETKDLGTQGKKAGEILKDMGAKGENAGSKLVNMFKGAFGALVAVAAIKKVAGEIKKFVGSAISAAVESEKVGAKFDAVFKDGAGAVSEWAEKYGKAAHRAKDEVKGFLVSSQAMYTQMGLGTDAATQMSEATTALAYDLGAAFKMSDSEALSGLQAAIQGDTKALSQMGVQLDEATLKQQAQSMGITKSIDDWDDATAAQVRFGAILQQTEKYQGEAINSIGGLSGGIKSLKSVFQNFMSDAGAKFAPAIEKLLGAVLEIWPKVEPALMQFVDLLSNGLGQAAPLLMGFASDILPIMAGNVGNLLSVIMPVAEILLDVVKTVLPPLSAQFKLLGSTLAPVLVGVLSKLYESAIKPLLPLFIQFVENVLPPLVSIIGDLAGTVLPPLVDIFGVIIQSVLPALMSLFEEVTTSILPPLVEGFQLVMTHAVQPLIPLIERFAQEILPPLVSIFGNIISTLLPPLINLFKEVATNVIPPVQKVFEKLMDALSPIMVALQDLMSKLLPIVSDLFSGLGPILGTVLSALSPVADMLGVVVGWVGKLIEFVSNGAGKVVDFFRNLTSGTQSASDAGASIPHNATGTDDFQGGPTFMNEAGGELAVLPKGSVIVPADKSQRIVNQISQDREDVANRETSYGTAVVNNVIDITPYLQQRERPLTRPDGTNGGDGKHKPDDTGGHNPARKDTTDRQPPKMEFNFNITIHGNISEEQKQETEEWFRRIVKDTMDEYNDELYDERIVQDASNM